MPVQLRPYCALFLVVLVGAAGGDPRPPVAARKPHEIIQHGERRVDEYFWLRDKNDPAVIEYLKAENAYCEAMMRPLEGLRETLYRETLARLKEDDDQPPYPKDGWLYYSRTEKGRQYPIQCRRRGLDSPERVVLDLNELAAGQSFFSMDVYEPSDDGHLVAYSTDVTGSREYTLRVRDLRTGKDLADRIENVTAAAWAADNRTLFYVLEDDAKRPYRLYRRIVGQRDDELLYEEGDRQFNLAIERSRSKAFVVVLSESATTTEVRVIDARRPGAAPRVVQPRREGHEYYLDHRDEEFFIRTTDVGRNFRLVRAPVADPGFERWKEVVAHRDDVMLENVQCFAGHVALYERANGLPRIRVMDPTSHEVRTVEVSEAVYSLFPDQNHQFDAVELRYRFGSFTTPWTVYAYDMKGDTARLLKRTEVLGGYDPLLYKSERLHATAADGTRIPISLVYRKDAPPGPRPMLLVGYGAYGFPSNVYFQHALPSLLDRGLAFAVAHVRGGGELGKMWHDQGRMTSKVNTFTDFIACAEHLIGTGRTVPDRLAIKGVSAGGLLMGAVLNLRPELFKCAVLEVPFVDVLNTMSDDTIPLTTQEYIEWGNPNVKVEYDYIKAYCPYTNLGQRAYPAVLLKTSLNDSQVPYWESAKYVAKLRGMKLDRNPLLLHVNLDAGHGGSSGRYDSMREAAVADAFVVGQIVRQ